MRDLTKKLEVGANVAIILLAVLVTGIVIRNYFFPPSAAMPEIKPGQAVSLADVDWKKNGRTLLVIMQEGCHFCTDSAPFYRRLEQQVKQTAGVSLVAVLPQTPAQARKYLAGLSLSFADVRQADIGKVGAAGTPTLILVDGKGAVVRAWVGQLPADKEAEVLSALQRSST